MALFSDIKIQDTTLRDGEQMPGVAFGFDEKIRIAEKAVEFGVDLIDIMPAVSESEFRVTKELTRRFGRRITPACRLKKTDIDTAIDAGASRVVLISPLSDLHITQRLGISREKNLGNSLDMIDYAASHGLVADIAGEDASRADIGYLKEFLGAVHRKISIFFLSDTVGCLTPKSTGELVSLIKNNFDCPIALHMHNDFGLATANTVEGLLAGADYFSGTFTGIGERAGNAPIEEVCAALHFLCGKELKVDYRMLKGICDMVQDSSGVRVQRHKPVIGENAFSHEAGIHVDGVLKNPRTYEFIDPAAVGHERKICLGKHSGKRALEHVLSEKFHLKGVDPADIDMLLEEIKAMHKAGKPCFSDEDVSGMIARIGKRKGGAIL